jgi:hypothetical protein
MSHHAVRRFAAVLVVVLGVSGSAFAQCSLHMLRGTWAFQNQGTVMMPVPASPVPAPVPFVSQGLMRVDHEGGYTLHATLSIGGQVQDVDAPGTIQVNPDCTATAVDSLGGTAQLVIIDGGNEMRVMATKHPLGPSTGIGRFRHIARGEPECTNRMVRGVYLGTAEATYLVPVPGLPQPVPTPFSGIFRMIFDREGTGVASATGSLGGILAEVDFSEMSMQVNRDCTATLKYRGVVKQAGLPAFGTINYIVLNHGDELIGMEIESNFGLPIELESHKRVSMRPGFER